MSARQTAAEEIQQVPGEKSIYHAYTYLLGRMLVIRQELIDSSEESFTYNRIKCNPLPRANSVNPNLDVALLEAWVAVDKDTPALLEIPEITGRYYTAQLIDEWGRVITNINERTFPSKPFGKFALLAPGSIAETPTDATRIFLHSNKAKLVGLVELKDDPDRALLLQRKFKLRSLGTPFIAEPPAISIFGNEKLIGVEIFDELDKRLASAVDVSPQAQEMQEQTRAVAAFVSSGPQSRAVVDEILNEKIIPKFQEYATTAAAGYRNHWMVGEHTRNVDSDYLRRTAVNYMRIWGNSSDEVIYFGAFRDVLERTLNGSHSYIMHFPPNGLPDSVVNAYWSVILVTLPDYRVFSNSLDRYNFNNHSPLQTEPNGSVKIAIGPKAVVGIPESNRLPSPQGKQFTLTFRACVPKDIVKREWAPPPLVRQD